jgi:hypothetical protein
MQSNGARAALLVVLVGVAVLLFVVLSGGDEDDGSDTATTETTATATTATVPPEPQPEVITLRNGEPVGGVKELEYTKGDQVLIEVRLDEQQEDVHIHGYDIEKLNPSGTVTFDFPADLTGIFELEAHGPSGDVQLAEIVVNP